MKDVNKDSKLTTSPNNENELESSISNSSYDLPMEDENNQLYPASLGLAKSTLPPWMGNLPHNASTTGIELPAGFDPEASLRTVDFGTSTETVNSDTRRESRSLGDESLTVDLEGSPDIELSEEAEKKLLAELRELGVEQCFTVDDDEKTEMSDLSIGNESYILDLAMQKETRESLLKEEALEEAANLYKQAKKEGHRGEQFFLTIFKELLRQKTAAKVEFFKLQDERLDRVLEAELKKRQKANGLSSSSHHSQGRKSERVSEFVQRESFRKSALGMRGNMIQAMSELTIQMNDDGDYEWGGDDENDEDEDSDATVDLAETKEEKIKKKKRKKRKAKPKKKKSKSSKSSSGKESDDNDSKVRKTSKKSKSKGSKKAKKEDSEENNDASGDSEMELKLQKTAKAPKSPNKKKKMKDLKAVSPAKKEKVKKLKVPGLPTADDDENDTNEDGDTSEKSGKKKEKAFRSTTKKPVKKRSKNKRTKQGEGFESPAMTDNDNDFQSPDLQSPSLLSPTKARKQLPKAPLVESDELTNKPPHPTVRGPRFGSLDTVDPPKLRSPRKKANQTLSSPGTPHRSPSKMSQFVNAIKKKGGLFRRKKNEEANDDPANRLLPIPGSQLQKVN